MADERERWDARHTAAVASPLAAPDGFFLDALAVLEGSPGTSALDLASGRGRHALELARRGHATEAWDVSPVALGALSQAAAARELRVVTRAVDLCDGLPEGIVAFDLVVVFDFLDRGLLARLWRLVRPGGHALVSTFTTDRGGEHPSARWCLEPGELAAGLPGLESVLHRERDGRAGLLARRGEAG
ncbi:MAG: SAM-dependent methyltransferase [Planctomycetes bacterium]|jgi:SAM-dependent methyltransferase|nr:SAM-dependent methyltransferase [Planctomycetota bacterium]MDP6408584.1 methyltransferase domain-containing protein [Planctomycetota bacterium]